jgi:hypothetical protein
MHSTTASYESIAIHFGEDYTTEQLWHCLAYWEYEKLKTLGLLYTCEDAGEYIIPMERIIQRMGWYSYLLMRKHNNA